MKKTFLSGLGICVLSVSLLASCQTSTNVETDISPENFAYQTTSTLNMMSDLSSSSSKITMIKNALGDSEDSGDSESSDQTVSLDEIEKTVKSYIGQADLYLSNESIPYSLTEQVSDKEEYAYKQTLSYTDINNTEQSYDIYFNIENSFDWENTGEDGNKQDNKNNSDKGNQYKGGNQDDDKGNGHHLSFKEGEMMSGIALYNDFAYSFQAKRMSFTNNNVSVEKIGMRMSYTQDDYSSCITTYYKLQTNNNKAKESFEYKIRENGEDIMEFEICKPSDKNGRLELELNNVEYEFRLGDSYNGNEGHFIFVAINDDESDVIFIYQRLINEDNSVTYTLITEQLTSKIKMKTIA